MAPPGLIYSLVLSGAEAGTSIPWSELEHRQLNCSKPQPGVDPDPLDALDREVIWLHLDYTCSVIQDWLQQQSSIDDVIIEALLREEARPRVSAVRSQLLMSLRSINFAAEASPEDMVAIRVWTNGRIIITTRKRHVLAIAELVEAIKTKQGPETVSGFLVEMIEMMILSMQETITDVDDSVDAVEELAVSKWSASIRSQVAEIRRLAIVLRRYLAPQREALGNLINNTSFSWIEVDDKVRLREAYDHLNRYIEDLDAVRDRAAVTQEELASRVAEQVNSRMYVLSLVAAIFLPLGFVTGLLGVNVGGIPGADDQNAFWWLSGATLFLVMLQVLLLKFKKWF